jgi:hypothetical protein
MRVSVRARHEVALVTNPRWRPGRRRCWSEIRSLRSYSVLLQQAPTRWTTAYTLDGQRRPGQEGRRRCRRYRLQRHPGFPDVRYTGRLKADEVNHLPDHLVREPALSRLGVTAIACLWKV